MAKTVLIVEDNELNMKLFRDLLEAHGIGTIETRSGMDVLDIARNQRPDLILMDIQLPEVSGLDVTKWLKADDALKSIPVIAVTAFAMKGDEDKIRQGGCEDYISKPISVSRFLEVVQTHLEKSTNQEVVQSQDVQEDEPSFQIQDKEPKHEDDDIDLSFLDEDEVDVIHTDHRGS